MRPAMTCILPTTHFVCSTGSSRTVSFRFGGTGGARVHTETRMSWSGDAGGAADDYFAGGRSLRWPLTAEIGFFLGRGETTCEVLVGAMNQRVVSKLGLWNYEPKDHSGPLYKIGNAPSIQWGKTMQSWGFGTTSRPVDRRDGRDGCGRCP